MTIVTAFQLTAKGKESLGSHTLEQYEQTILLMLSKNPSVADITAKGLVTNEVKSALEKLFLAGLISPVISQATATPSSTKSKHQISPALLREEMSRAARTILEKNSKLVLTKIESTSTDFISLKECAQACVQLICLTIDEKKSEQLRKQFDSLLAKAK